MFPRTPIPNSVRAIAQFSVDITAIHHKLTCSKWPLMKKYTRYVYTV